MKKIRLFLLLILISPCMSALFAPGVAAWQNTLRDYPRSSSRAQAVAVDADGDVITAGTLPPFSVVKMSGATGALMWRFSVDGGSAPNDVAVDAYGDVFVSSGSRNVLKLSGETGERLWDKPVGGTFNAFQAHLLSVAVDLSGDVVTTGTVGGVFNVSKLDGRTGNLEWTYEREGYGKAVAVDPSGDVAAAGISNRNFAVVKLSGSDGHERWERELDGRGSFSDLFEEATAVAAGSDGSVVAVGNTSNTYANFRDFTVVKFGPGGDQLWSDVMDGRWCVVNDHGETVCQSNDTANDVALGEDGSVYVAGSQQTDVDKQLPGAYEHFYVAKYSKDGAFAWGEAAEDLPRGEEYTPGHAQSIAVDGDGNVVAAGQHGGRFMVVKYRGDGPAAGARLWRKQPGSPPTPGNPTQALEVAADAENNVVVVGETLAPDQFPLFSVFKLWGANGESFYGPPEPPPASQTPPTVLAYAPIVHLHSDDLYRPGDPAAFIYNSDLWWFHEGGCERHVVEGSTKVEPARLGNTDRAYTHGAILPRVSEADPCLYSNMIFYAGDYTRPYDGSARSAAANRYWWDNPFYEREGFYLDPRNDDELRHGIPSVPGRPVYPGAPVFYDYVPGQYVTYWFFYPYDEFTFPDGVALQFHEGDWERVSVQLDENDNPLHVFFYGHDGGQAVGWTETERFDNHPIVYSARGSHASYPHAGNHFLQGPIYDRANAGPEWHTWNDLRDVKTQPWYGFGGAWGQVGEDHDPVPGKDFTGPLGPSPYKNSAQTWARAIGGAVKSADGAPLAGVKVTISDAQANTVFAYTDDSGRYSFPYLKFGSEYTVAPSSIGYSFSPASRLFSYLRENQTADFTALDTVAPSLSLPGDINVNAASPSGAVVTYAVTATDNVTASPGVSCSPRSGSTFPVGTSVVHCVATDAAGNNSSGSFRVTVKGAAAQITDLISVVRQMGLKESDARRLERELEQTQKALGRGDAGAACREVKQFIKDVGKESAKSLTPEQAGQLSGAALQIKAALGCP